jgi:hypothetical protein
MLIEATTDLATRITGAIRDAARATGASFDYLLKTALRESNLNPGAKASTSSATGLFQFIDQTWLGTLKRSGAELGYGNYADAVAQTPSGRYVVTDPAQRQAVMNLRKDPAAASAMAGAFTKRNAALLTEKLGRKPTDGELYVAHFLGPTGAVRLISSTEASPAAKAARLFPHAARANRSIFYDKQGDARSLAQVYGALISKHDSTRAPFATAAAASEPAPVVPAVAVPPVAPVAALAPDFAPTVPPVVPAAYAAGAQPVFHGLFRTDAGDPLAPVVSELWGAKPVPMPRARAARVAQVPPAAAPAKATRAGRAPLDLFEFLRPEIQAKAPPRA